MHWTVSVIEESGAKALVLDPMQRDGADDSQSDASDSASQGETTKGLNDHSANTLPTAALYGAASMAAPQGVVHARVGQNLLKCNEIQSFG